MNFSLQSATGVEVKMNERWDLRLGLFGDFHFSNAFIVPVNLGLDVMNASLGVELPLREIGSEEGHGNRSPPKGSGSSVSSPAAIRAARRCSMVESSTAWMPSARLRC